MFVISCKPLLITFRALLYGGMRESQPQAEVRLEDTRVEAFSMLLRYLYTGRANLSEAKEETLLDFLGLAHRYGLQPLEASTCDYLRTLLNAQNVSLIFDVASLYHLSSLAEACCSYMDRHAVEVLKSDGFLALSKVSGEETRWTLHADSTATSTTTATNANINNQ